MRAFRFTAPRLAAIKLPPTGRTIIWDADVPGFGCWIYATGRRVFVLRYRDAAGRQRWITLGTSAELGPDDARRSARDKLAGARFGRDPAAERDGFRREPFVHEIAERYLKEHVQARNAPSAVPGIEGRVRNYIIPRLGHLKVSELTPGCVQAFHQSLKATPTQANRILAALSKMCSLAAKVWQVPGLKENPCLRMPKYGETPKERYFSAEELQKIGAALQALADSGDIPPVAAAAIRLIALTGLRRGEVLAARWSDFDAERGTLLLRQSKTGERAVPLGETAAKVILSLPHFGDCIFPGRDPDRPITASAVSRACQKVMRHAGLEGEATLHAFRRTAATEAARAGLNVFTMRDLFGWKNLDMPNRYAQRIPHHLRPHAEALSASLAAAFDQVVPTLSETKPNRRKASDR